MCRGSKTESGPSDLEMEGGLQVENEQICAKFCTKLLELAATDDLSGFIQEIEKGSDLDEAGFWYCRSLDSNKMGFERRTPLMIASLYGSISVLKHIVESGKVDVNRSCGSDGATALHCAAAGGSSSSLEVVRILIYASADVNAVNMNGKRAGDLVAPSVKTFVSSKKLEKFFNGVTVEGGETEEEEDKKTPKKEYPFDVSLPDINDGIYVTDEFRMYSFKVKPCSRAYSHDWTECPFVHPGENARRRDLRKYHYSCVPCPEFKKGSCGKGDNCEYAHGVFESWLHPAQYRTRICKDETRCFRKVCFFAHKPEELRPLYASTGSAMPSPKSVTANPLDLTTLSLSPRCSSPMGGGAVWQSTVNRTPPALQLQGSRMTAASSMRDVDIDMEILELEKIIKQQRNQQMLEEMTSFASTYSRIGDLKQNNLDDVFGSCDSTMISKMQGLSPKFNTQSMNQMRASYPSNLSSSPSRKYGFDSSAAVAAAVMNSRSPGFTQRSHSFIDRGRSPFSGAANSPALAQSKLSEWSSPDGKLDWGFNDDDVNKLRKSSSFGIRGGNGFTTGSGAALTPTVLSQTNQAFIE